MNTQQTNKQQQSDWPYAFSPLLAELDLFALLGLDHITDDEKMQLFLQMQGNVWMDVITNRIQQYLSAEDWETTKAMLSEGKEAEEITQFLEQKIPQLGEIIFIASVEYKHSYVLEYFGNLERITGKKLEQLQKGNTTGEQEVRQIQEQLQTIHQLHQYAQHNQWEHVQQLLPLFNQQQQAA